MRSSILAFVLLSGVCTASRAAPPQLRVALLGNPNTVPQWTDEQVHGLVDAGFNAVQLNVAWGSRPQNEPLNLNDVVGIAASRSIHSSLSASLTCASESISRKSTACGR